MSSGQVQELAERLLHGSRRSKVLAALHLGSLKDNTAESVLFAALGDRTKLVRAAAANALISIDDSRPPKPLVQALRKAEGKYRVDQEDWREPDAYEILALGLSRLKSLHPMETFTAALKDDDKHLRSLAATVLGESGDTDAVGPLIVALRDQEDVVREASAEALGKLGDQRSVAPLVSALGDRGVLVRRNAAVALSGMGEEARAALIVAEGSGDSLQRRGAANALRRLSARRWRRRWFPRLKREAG